MPSPKDDLYLLDVWQKLEKKYMSSGLSRWGSFKKIATEYSVSPDTVYYWLVPKHRTHILELESSNDYKKKKREWARHPENRALLSEYSKKYKKIRRNLYSYIQELFMEDKEMSLSSVSRKLTEKTNIKFDKKIILSAIAKYNYENEDNPIIEIEPDLYRIRFRDS